MRSSTNQAISAAQTVAASGLSVDTTATAISVSGDKADAIADVGTGPGFPGLPLALVSPQRTFTLIDSVAKKLRFVTHATRVLGLTNVTTQANALTAYTTQLTSQYSAQFTALNNLMATTNTNSEYLTELFGGANSAGALADGSATSQ